MMKHRRAYFNCITTARENVAVILGFVPVVLLLCSNCPVPRPRSVILQHSPRPSNILLSKEEKGGEGLVEETEGREGKVVGWKDGGTEREGAGTEGERGKRIQQDEGRIGRDFVPVVKVH